MGEAITRLNEIIEYAGIDRNLILSFFIFFSRFEFALKRAGYLRQGKGFAEPDWWAFEKEIKYAFNQDRNMELQSAIKYIEDNPPKRQFCSTNGLKWKSISCPKTFDGIWVVEQAKQVRNNLFHGGKFSDRIDNELARDKVLLQCSITILEACLEKCDAVKKEFFRQID